MPHVLRLLTRRQFVVVFGLAVALPAPPQNPSARPGATYAAIASLPDWSGVWVRPFHEFEQEGQRWRDPKDPTSPRLSAKAEAIRAAAVKALLAGEAARSDSPAPVAGTCAARGRPGGMPQVMRFAFGIELLFTPGRVTMLLEQGPTIRRIFTDGRAHSTDPEPTYTGESIGRWEGDTLVVDTRAISARAILQNALPTSGQARITERIRRIDVRRLQIDTVVEDPVMLAAPWSYRRTYERLDDSWFERVCENDRDGNDREPDLTPPR
jgi:hypothetical protein